MPSEHDIAFPRLSRTQIDALRPWGRVRPIAPGDVLFQEGDRGFSFYVVLDGAVEIVEQSRGTSREVTVHEPGEFTGDVDTLSGRASLVTGRATAPSNRRRASHTGRKKLMVSDIVVNDSSGFSVVTKAIPIAASATSHKMPPCSVPIGFAC